MLKLAFPRFHLDPVQKVYEFKRASGNLKGEIWRKIVHVPSDEVYPSFAKATKAGFDVSKLQIEA